MKESTESDPITICLNLTHSLLQQEIPTVHHLKSKWSIARVKLTSLQTHLTDFSTEYSTSSTSNPLSLHLLHSISQTLHDAVSLAHHCQSTSPDLPLGKLQTQSHLDSLIATLHRHLNDCDVLFRSGLLLETPAFSKREAVRSLSRNLIARLQIGSPDSRAAAIDSLLSLLHEDDKNVTIAVAQGVVPVLVRLLDSSSDMKEKTVAAISRVSTVDSGKNNLLAEGLMLLNHLLRVLDSGSGLAIEKACIALQALSFTRDNARAIGSRGGISSLLGICQGGTPGSQASAAAVLRNLAKFNEIRENFAEENAIVVLLGLASSGTILAQENAIGCVANLISEDEGMRVLVYKEGGVECLKNFWDSAPMIQSLEVAVEMLRYLAMTGPIGEVLVAEGFIGRVMGVLNCEVLTVSVLTFFKTHGFSIQHTQSIIRRIPHLILSNPIKTILPKFQFLASKGASPTDIVATVTRSPFFLCASLHKHIIPSFQLVRSFCPSDKKAIDSIIICPTSISDRLMKPNLQFLIDSGVTPSSIYGLFCSRPSVICSADLREVVEEIKGLGFHPSNYKFCLALLAKRAITKSQWDAKIDAFKCWGFSEDAIFNAFKRNPKIMLRSADKLNAVMSFWIKELGWDPSLLMAAPDLFEFSLEKRLIPRALVVRYLLSKGLIKKGASLRTPFHLSDDLFMKKYVNCYEKESSRLLRLYQGKNASI